MASRQGESFSLLSDGGAIRIVASFAWAFTLAAFGCQTLHLKPVSPAKNGKAPGEKTASLPALPTKNEMRVSQFFLYSNLELKLDTPLFQEIATLPEQVYKELQLPHAGTIVLVYLFEDRDTYEAFMHARYPDLPKRRAFFVVQPRGVGAAEDLLVYTYWGDKVREDLRHEATHALLHSVLKDVPLWLDEGLAEYFEVDPTWQGINPRHIDHIRHASPGRFQPDLDRLERVSQVSQMSPADYREAWAWVHLMLRETPDGKAVLMNYLQQLRTSPNPGPLGPRLDPVFKDRNAALDQHLIKLESIHLPAQSVKN
jgi:hypothetical protein